MTYKDLTIEQARQVCKLNRKDCKKCPLRREKEDTNGKVHLLFCYFIISTMYDVWKEQKDELDNELIKYEEEVKKEIEELKK